jgi:hypothetical protein
MAKKPNDAVLNRLREIRAILDDHSKQLRAIKRIERQLAELRTTKNFSLDQSFARKIERLPHQQRQRYRSQLDELMDRFEKLSPAERKRDIASAEAILRAQALGQKAGKS